ncbi:DMT family transporter [Pseudodonghicola xiamenensis]|uniref:DMT transporter permease n=1 Tax=Pseudodonghicola xiamenensis TaxID=337702 RepID=A0A8J3MBU3_9RHOB|nr:DMT family transporter [Pseudodonghicola xiamenensis]GHG80813.1 DMT transporter permease [Pseudodonghicola xiamenensis]
MQDQTPPRVGRAALWMTGAIISFSAMAVAGRAVSFALDTFEIMMYRSGLGVLIILVFLGVTRGFHQINRRGLKLQFSRNLAHFIGQNLWFFAITVIPLAQVFALEFTSPLWVVVLAPLLLGERLTPLRALSAAIGFIGILVVARPSPDTLNLGVFAAAAAAVFFALTTLFTKRLTRDHSVANIMFWLTSIQLVLGMITAGADGDIALPDASTLPWLLVIALAGLIAHSCVANALSIAPATVVVPLDFVRLPAIAVIGMVLYGEPLDIWVLVGAVIIFAGNYLNITSETRGPRPSRRAA